MTNYGLPKCIVIDEQSNTTVPIRNDGDFRVVLDCFDALNDVELNKEEKIISALYIFYADYEEVEDVLGDELMSARVTAMFNFFNCGQEETGPSHSYKLVDWEKDATLIFSAVNSVAGKEVRSEEYMHWWTFAGFYSSIGECTLSTIISIREKIAKGEKLESYERKFKTNNPQYFSWSLRTAEQDEADKLARELWNSGV